MSRKAPTDAPKKCLFCEVRQGGGAYGKSASGAAFSGVSFFAHMFFPGLSPGSVDNRVSVFEKGESARRSRTTERSELVSEEAEQHKDNIRQLRAVVKKRAYCFYVWLS